MPGCDGAGLTNIRDRVVAVGYGDHQLDIGRGTVGAMTLPWPAKPAAAVSACTASLSMMAEAGHD